MKIKITKDVLNHAVQNVVKAISSRTTIPILSGILFEVHEQSVSLTASDAEITIKSFIPLEREERVILEINSIGSVVIPAKFFVDIVRKMPEDDIFIETNESHHIVIKSGSAEVNLVGMDADEFPALPSIENEQKLRISSELLQTMVRQTAFAVLPNETTPVLTGVQWKIGQEDLTFTATDRHRLATRTITLQDPAGMEGKQCIVPAKTLNELSRLIPDRQELIDIQLTGSQIRFELSDLVLYSRLLEGSYPDTSRLLQQEFKTEMLISTKTLYAAIERAYLLSREEKANIVKWSASTDGILEISSSSAQIGKVREELKVQEYKGEPLQLSFNSKYMMDALKVFDCDFIRFGFTGIMSPIILKPEDQSKMIHLILPYRTVQ